MLLLKLPQEILSTIVLDLGFEDKLSLVLTCRSLKEVISNSLLYEELTFYHKKDALPDALAYFKDKPIYSSQVRRLKLSRTIVTSQALSQLPIVFPKVSEFSSIYAHSEMDDSYMAPMLNWKNTLEKYHVPNKQRQIVGLLKDNTFSRLSSLSVTSIYAFGKDANGSMVNFHEFSCLKNAPLLKHLRLIGGRMSFEALEKIHTVCPQLNSLRLTAVTLVAQENHTLPLSISSATRLLSLIFDWGTDIEDQGYMIWDYIIAKYTHLIELELLCNWEDIVSDSNENIVDSNSDYYRKPDDFISSLPNTIKKLTINNDLFDDPITALEETGINPTELAFYDNDGLKAFPAEVVGHEHHSDYIKRLGLLRVLVYCVRCNRDNNKNGVIFDNITHLTVMMLDNKRYGGCELDRLLATYPSLQSLTINEGSDLLTIGNSFSQKTYPNLKKLAIKSQNLDEKVIDFIRTALPNIKEFDLPIFGKRHSNGRLWYLYKHRCSGSNNTGYDLDSGFCIDLSGCALDVFNLLATWEKEINWFDTLLYLEIQTLNGIMKYTITTRSYLGVYAYLTNGDAIRQSSNVVKIICDDIKTFRINVVTALELRSFEIIYLARYSLNDHFFVFYSYSLSQSPISYIHCKNRAARYTNKDGTHIQDGQTSFENMG
ncbi:hypothetical protein K501DRAFT_338035 [Backusella circina FSU 941]|nr:hypothetical protein K501DRAFT_338035 [Backusella circina FSU 941]